MYQLYTKCAYVPNRNLQVRYIVDKKLTGFCLFCIQNSFLSFVVSLKYQVLISLQSLYEPTDCEMRNQQGATK